MSDSRPTVAISSDFLGAFARIPRAQQKKVQEFISKFRHDPTSSGINYEKIRDSRSAGVHSVRIDQTYRGVVLKPDQGNVYMLMWVDKHDEAYDWARRHECLVHPSTGALQVIEAEHDAADVSHQQSADQPETASFPDESEPSPPLFGDYSQEQILALGVPERFIARVMALKTVEQLERLEARLPAEAYEPLYLLAAGDDYQALLEEYNERFDAAEPVDVNDYDQAMKRTASQRRFHVVADELELQQMLNAPLEQWRVFLHPSQRKLVEAETKGPMRVLGGAGTGKTVVAMHRARWLAKRLMEQPGKKVLFTTFTRNLAADIQHNLAKICDHDELSRIEVINIDAFVTRLLKRHHYDLKAVYENDKGRELCWSLAMQLMPAELGLPESFYAEEWFRVVQPQQIHDKAGYFRASRTGRGTALTRVQRAQVWPVFEEFRRQMSKHGLRDMNDAMFDAIALLREQQVTLPYAHLVVDEGQDMGAPAFTLLRAIIPEGPDDICIVGDGHQRIYRNKVVLGQCGINVRGRRSKKLKINYRTTEETRKFAVRLLTGVLVDDLDGEQDKSQDYLSLFHGQPPVVRLCPDFNEEVDFIRDEIALLSKEDVPLKAICVVARTKHLRDRYADALRQADLTVQLLDGDSSDDEQVEGVRLATLHRVKGLEFQYVFLAGINRGVVPLPFIQHTADPVELRDNEFNERALLHVAATRAVKGLYVSCGGEPSPYLV